MQRNNEEHRIQSAIIQAADSIAEIRGRLFAIPNGGHRDVRTGVKLKREGVRPGIPDLFLPVARGSFHGLFIEVKTVKGRMSDEQSDWREYLVENQYESIVVRSAQEAIDAIMDYLWRLR